MSIILLAGSKQSTYIGSVAHEFIMHGDTGVVVLCEGEPVEFRVRTRAKVERAGLVTLYEAGGSGEVHVLREWEPDEVFADLHDGPRDRTHAPGHSQCEDKQGKE